MWIVHAHISGSTFSAVAVIFALGVFVRPILRYPHMWRYLEVRARMRYGWIPSKDRRSRAIHHLHRAPQGATSKSPRLVRKVRDSLRDRSSDA